MSFFDASKAQAGANPQNPAQGMQGGFTGGATGASDASKGLSTGFNFAPMTNLPRTGGGLFGSTLGGAAAPAAPSFGATPTAGIQGAGINLGAAAPTPGTNLTFGATSTPSTGLNFGTSGGTATVTGFGSSGFSSGGLTSAAPTSASGGLSFGAPKPAATMAAPGFSLGGTTATPASTAPKLTFGMGASTPAASTGFSLGGIAATAATTTPASSAAPAAPATGFGLSTPAATIVQTPGVPLGAPTSTTGFSLTPSSSAQPLASSFGVAQQTPAAATAATTASTGFSLGGATATPVSGFNLGSAAAPTLSSGFAINKTTTTQAAATTVAATNVAPQTSLGTVTTVSSAAASGQAGTINFCQLEESINKWTLELEEQEKAFVNQATQVNTWDKLLIANGEKITTLNQEVERVKLEQQHLEHELDYVVGQQKELQDCLVPLEKELASLTVTDPERDYTYRLAENLDKQLKQMSQDLKEIIEHLNEANRSQDSSDPIVQIGKILNAHMNSLQWLDQRTSVLGQKIQQIDQMHQNFRQENERSFNLAYN